MIYTEKLTKLATLRQLAWQIKNFPITGLGIVQSAEHMGYDDETIDFIELFSGRRVFNSRSDFMYHCRLLNMLLKEEKCSLAEHSASSEED